MRRKRKPDDDDAIMAPPGECWPAQVTEADIARLMDYVRQRHLDSCCDHHGRTISTRDSVWSMLSADVVQEILVAHVRLQVLNS